jgi:hypothetical protein
VSSVGQLVFTIPILAFTMPIRVFTMGRSWRSRSADPAVHDVPIRAFTIGRNPQPGPDLGGRHRGGRRVHAVHLKTAGALRKENERVLLALKRYVENGL